MTPAQDIVASSVTGYFSLVELTWYYCNKNRVVSECLLCERVIKYFLNSSNLNRANNRIGKESTVIARPPKWSVTYCMVSGGRLAQSYHFKTISSWTLLQSLLVISEKEKFDKLSVSVETFSCEGRWFTLISKWPPAIWF